MDNSLKVGDQILKVKSINDKKVDECGKSLFKVQWEDSWMSEDDLENCKHLIDEFHKQEQVLVEVLGSPCTDDGSQVYVLRLLTTSSSSKNNCVSINGLEGHALIDRLNQAVDENRRNNNINEDTELKDILEQYHKPSTISPPHDISPPVMPLPSSVASMVPTKSHIYPQQSTYFNEAGEHVRISRRGRWPGKKKTLSDLYHCASCGAAFVHQTHLKIHERTHTGERPYKCDICGRSFAQKGNLRVHMKIHTGEKDFHCHLCDRKFITNAQLVVHMRTHTNPNRKKPYQLKRYDDNINTIVHILPEYQHHNIRYETKSETGNWKRGNSPINSVISTSPKTAFISSPHENDILDTSDSRHQELFSFGSHQNEALNEDEDSTNVVHILAPTI